jgi:hypothetical protein
MIKVEEAKELQYRQEIYHQHLRNKDRTPLRARINGKCKLWKRSPERFEIPIKHGLYDSGYLTETNNQDWCLSEDDAMLHPLRHFGDWCLYTNKTGLRPTKFICNTCGQMKHIPSVGPSNYTLNGKYLMCFECGDKTIKDTMIKTGKISLSLKFATRQEEEAYYKEYEEKNPGVFPVRKQFVQLTGLSGQVLFRSFHFYETKYYHDLKKMIHLWFKGPDEHIWYGKYYINGYGSENCYCKRTKKTKF